MAQDYSFLAKPVEFNPLLGNQLAQSNIDLRRGALDVADKEATIKSNRAVSQALQQSTNEDGTVDYAKMHTIMAHSPDAGYNAQAAYENAASLEGQDLLNSTNNMNLATQRLGNLHQAVEALFLDTQQGKPVTADQVRGATSDFVKKGLISPDEAVEFSKNVPDDPTKIPSFLQEGMMHLSTAAQQIEAVKPVFQDTGTFSATGQQIFLQTNPAAPGGVRQVPLGGALSTQQRAALRIAGAQIQTYTDSQGNVHATTVGSVAGGAGAAAPAGAGGTAVPGQPTPGQPAPQPTPGQPAPQQMPVQQPAPQQMPVQQPAAQQMPQRPMPMPQRPMPQQVQQQPGQPAPPQPAPGTPPYPGAYGPAPGRQGPPMIRQPADLGVAPNPQVSQQRQAFATQLSEDRNSVPQIAAGVVNTKLALQHMGKSYEPGVWATERNRALSALNTFGVLPAGEGEKLSDSQLVDKLVGAVNTEAAASAGAGHSNMYLGTVLSGMPDPKTHTKDSLRYLMAYIGAQKEGEVARVNWMSREYDPNQPDTGVAAQNKWNSIAAYAPAVIFAKTLPASQRETFMANFPQSQRAMLAKAAGYMNSQHMLDSVEEGSMDAGLAGAH